MGWNEFEKHPFKFLFKIMLHLQDFAESRHRTPELSIKKTFCKNISSVEIFFAMIL